MGLSRRPSKKEYLKASRTTPGLRATGPWYQARAWFKSGDTSWAPYTFSIDVSDTECSHIIVGGKKIHVSTHSPLIDGDSLLRLRGGSD